MVRCDKCYSVCASEMRSVMDQWISESVNLGSVLGRVLDVLITLFLNQGMEVEL